MLRISALALRVGKNQMCCLLPFYLFYFCVRDSLRLIVRWAFLYVAQRSGATRGLGLNMRVFSIMYKFSKYKTIFKFSKMPKSLVTAVMCCNNYPSSNSLNLSSILFLIGNIFSGIFLYAKADFLKLSEFGLSPNFLRK